MTPHYPIIEVCGESAALVDKQLLISLRIDSGKRVCVDSRDLIRAINNSIELGDF